MTPGPAPGGLVLVDKPAGMTSHDVVARIRRLAGTRKVGHAGTLDPMATGVLVVGVEKATRLLGHLTLADKDYQATIRLGQETSTDDAEGAVTATAGAAAVTEDAVRRAVAALTGPIEQIPPGVSAIKVGGQRAYKLTRDGQAPELAARKVTVLDFTVTGLRHRAGPDGDFLDLEPMIRDAVVLALPMSPLCRDDCQGLCVECGVPLAEAGPEHGHEGAIDPRWANLKQL